MKLILFLIIAFSILLIFYINKILSLPLSFTTEKSCSNVFGDCSDNEINDALLGCNGTTTSATREVNDVYINQTTFLSGRGINVTCNFKQVAGTYHSEYLWYYDANNWYTIQNWTDTTGATSINRSVVFNLNPTPGMHIVRCIINANLTTYMNVSRECANLTYTQNTWYDNDDVNFTVTDYPKYTFWNLTNYTTGATIQDGSHLTRNDTINASAQWDKQLYNANISHNGTGTFQNYTICSPCSGTWTNYTLNLSNTAEFNRTGRIEISYIWVNDTYGLENYTSNKHFYLWENSKVGQIYINSSSIYNNTGARIFCLVLDKDLNQPISSYNVSFYMNNGG